MGLGLGGLGVRIVPVLAGLVKEPKPWAATLPTPVLKVPLGLGSPKEDVPNPKVFAPLFPNRLLDPGDGERGVTPELLRNKTHPKHLPNTGQKKAPPPCKT